MVRSSKLTSKGFTFAESLGTIALLVLSAGLAAQLLVTSLGFTQRFGVAQRHYQDLLSVKTGLLLLASRVKPPLWANPESSFQEETNRCQVDYWEGAAGSKASLVVDAQGYLRWTDPRGEVVWGPWPGASVSFWERDDRKVGLKVNLTDKGTNTTLKFPWGSWPL